jgi:hypothetical protein
MIDTWMIVGAMIAVVAGFVLLGRRERPMVFASPREEQLTRRLARIVGCPLADALPAVQRELDLAPGQSDDTLIKRAEYHYRQDLPEKSCSVYRDRVRG